MKCTRLTAELASVCKSYINDVGKFMPITNYTTLFLWNTLGLQIAQINVTILKWGYFFSSGYTPHLCIPCLHPIWWSHGVVKQICHVFFVWYIMEIFISWGPHHSLKNIQSNLSVIIMQALQEDSSQNDKSCQGCFL